MEQRHALSHQHSAWSRSMMHALSMMLAHSIYHMPFIQNNNWSHAILSQATLLSHNISQATHNISQNYPKWSETNISNVNPNFRISPNTPRLNPTRGHQHVTRTVQTQHALTQLNTRPRNPTRDFATRNTRAPTRHAITNTQHALTQNALTQHAACLIYIYIYYI